MNHPLTFTTPPEPVQQARLAMARAEQRLALDVGPLEPCWDLTGIGLAFLTLETVHPAYHPLLEVEASPDPRADLLAAIDGLALAIADASSAYVGSADVGSTDASSADVGSAADIARYVATIRDLRDLDLLADAGGGDPCDSAGNTDSTAWDAEATGGASAHWS
jgi:hypothetical protein